MIHSEPWFKVGGPNDYARAMVQFQRAPSRATFAPLLTIAQRLGKETDLWDTLYDLREGSAPSWAYLRYMELVQHLSSNLGSVDECNAVFAASRAVGGENWPPIHGNNVLRTDREKVRESVPLARYLVAPPLIPEGPSMGFALQSNVDVALQDFLQGMKSGSIEIEGQPYVATNWPRGFRGNSNVENETVFRDSAEDIVDVREVLTVEPVTNLGQLARWVQNVRGET